MNEFDSFSSKQGRDGATSTESANSTASPERTQQRDWRHLPQFLRAIWASKKRAQPGAPSGGRSPGRHWPIVLFAVILAIPIAGSIAGYLRRLTPKNAAQAGFSAPGLLSGSGGETVAKPAPGKPMVESTELAPVAPSSALPAAPAIPSIPPADLTLQGSAAPPPRASAAGNTGAMAPAPAGTAGAPFAPIVYPARHEKHFGESCSGQLTLDSNGLVFHCSDDPRGSLRFSLNQIDAVDDNGIRTTSGKKYHFAIAGMSKGGEEELFAQWFNRVR